MPENTADIGRAWFAALDPEMRALILRVLALRRTPNEVQIRELPALIAPSYAFDAMGIAEEHRAAIRAAVAELVARLPAKKKRSR